MGYPQTACGLVEVKTNNIKIASLEKARAGREGNGLKGKGIPAPPERKILKFGVRIFLEISSDFVQEMEQ